MTQRKMSMGQVGQLLYDLAFVHLTDKWIACKHGITQASVRRLRSKPEIKKLVKQREREQRK